MTSAHVAGIPIEESVMALAPAGAAFFYMATAWLRGRGRP
jgi:hypothetical protein